LVDPHLVLGIGLSSLTVIGPHTWFGLLGLVPLATGLVGWCPIYRLVGINTGSTRGHTPDATHP
jgi:hypothetical protein